MQLRYHIAFMHTYWLFTQNTPISNQAHRETHIYIYYILMSLCVLPVQCNYSRAHLKRVNCSYLAIKSKQLTRIRNNNNTLAKQLHLQVTT